MKEVSPLIVKEFTSCGSTGYFFIYSFNPGYLSKGNSIVLWVEGGVGPFQWNVSGSDFTFTDADDQWAVIKASETVPQDTTETVTVTDSCGTSVTGTVCACDADAVPCCDNPPPILYDSDNPEILEAGEIVTIEISGGCGPYKWETLPISPSDYHFEAKYTNDPKNDLHAVTANKAFSIRIIDSCGTQYGPDDFSINSLMVIVDDLDDVGDARWLGEYSGCYSPSYIPPAWSLDDLDTIGKDECDYFSIIDGLPPFIYWPEGDAYLPTTDGTALVLVAVARTITICSNEDGTSYLGRGVMDICGNTSLAETDISTCCDEGEHSELEFDDGLTTDTIVRNTSISIYVSGGCGPYSWVVSGTGFSLEHSTTDDNENSLLADGTACGAAEITCTDLCGHTVTFYIRCTEGSWDKDDAGWCCSVGCSFGLTTCRQVSSMTITSENKQYYFSGPFCTYGTSCDPTSLGWTLSPYTDCAENLINPPGISPNAAAVLAGESCVGNCGASVCKGCVFLYVDTYHWVC